MSWITLSIMAAVLTGLGNVGEKVLASRYMPDTASLMGWLAISVAGYGIVFAILYPFAAGTPPGHIIAVFDAIICDKLHVIDVVDLARLQVSGDLLDLAVNLLEDAALIVND